MDNFKYGPSRYQLPDFVANSSFFRRVCIWGRNKICLINHALSTIDTNIGTGPKPINFIALKTVLSFVRPNTIVFVIVFTPAKKVSWIVNCHISFSFRACELREKPHTVAHIYYFFRLIDQKDKNNKSFKLCTNVLLWILSKWNSLQFSFFTWCRWKGFPRNQGMLCDQYEVKKEHNNAGGV